MPSCSLNLHHYICVDSGMDRKLPVLGMVCVLLHFTEGLLIFCLMCYSCSISVQYFSETIPSTELCRYQARAWKQHSFGKVRIDLCSGLSIPVSFPISHYGWAHSQAQRTSTDPCRTVYFENQNPMGSYQPNRPNNPHCSQVPNKLFTHSRTLLQSP